MAVCIEALPGEQGHIFQANRYPLGGPRYYVVLPHGADCLGGSRKFRRGGPDNLCINALHRGQRTNLSRETIGPERSNCFLRGSVPVFLRGHIVTCDFPGVSGSPVPPLDPPMGWTAVCDCSIS